jgi:SAM-dependent methyltransferase
MAEATLDAIGLPSGANVLDVACGTGAVARAVAARLRQPSRIVGADLNPAMIEIARQRTPAGAHSFDWHAAPADDLPFKAGHFDLVFCQQGLQFFPDKPGALAEMRRVLRPGGRLYLTCWAAIPPFFEVVAGVLRRRLGEDAAAKAVEPFIWNDGGLIGRLISAAGFEVELARRVTVTRRMPATYASIRADILATPNEPALRAAGESAIESIVQEVFEGVSHFSDGEMLAMPQEAYLFDAILR